MNRLRMICGLLIAGVVFSAYAAAPVGWACFATTGGSVYKVKVGGTPIQIPGVSGARHARWSVDGSLIFYVDASGKVYSVNNDGSNRQEIGSGASASFSPIAAYRPDAACVMMVKDGAFYKVSSVSKTETLIGRPNLGIAGEIAISSDGKRIAFRKNSNGGNAFDITNGECFEYYGACSASISPDGNWTTGNLANHGGTYVFPWWSRSGTSLPCPFSSNDNQGFAVNSNEWIIVLKDNSVGANKGQGCGLVNRVTMETYTIATWSVGNTQYPDFFVGELPDPGTTSVRKNSATEAALKPIFALSGHGLLKVTPATRGNYTIKLFNAKGAVIGSFEGNSVRTFDLSTLCGLIIVKMQAGDRTFVNKIMR